MAQAAHAANDAVEHLSGEKSLCAWEDQGGTFGTTIVLDANYKHDVKRIYLTCSERHIREWEEVKTFLETSEVSYGIVLDLTYPLKDGQTSHKFPVETCAWVFGDKEELEEKLKNFKLHS